MWSLAVCTSPAAAKLVAGDDGAWPEEASRASPDLAQGSQGGDQAGEGRAGRRCCWCPVPAGSGGQAAVWRRRGRSREEGKQVVRRCGGGKGAATHWCPVAGGPDDRRIGNSQNKLGFAVLMHASTTQTRRGCPTARRGQLDCPACAGGGCGTGAWPCRPVGRPQHSLGAAHGSPSVRSHRRRDWVHSGVAQTSVRRRIDPMTRGRRIRNAHARTRAL
jgi:hypothetical protein